MSLTLSGIAVSLVGEGGTLTVLGSGTSQQTPPLVLPNTRQENIRQYVAPLTLTSGAHIDYEFDARTATSTMYTDVNATMLITGLNSYFTVWKPTPASSATALATYALKPVNWLVNQESADDSAPQVWSHVNDHLYLTPNIPFNQGTIFLVATMTANWADVAYRQSLLAQFGGIAFRWMQDTRGYLSRRAPSVTHSLTVSTTV